MDHTCRRCVDQSYMEFYMIFIGNNTDMRGFHAYLICKKFANVLMKLESQSLSNDLTYIIVKMNCHLCIRNFTFNNIDQFCNLRSNKFMFILKCNFARARQSSETLISLRDNDLLVLFFFSMEEFLF